MPSPLPILAIVGVTGSGKNQLAQEVARRTGASLISIDSRKVYRGLNIGTAKPSPEIIREFDYGMIDCADPREYFSAGRYCREARALATERLASGRPVIMVGGTGFYLEAFMTGLADLPEISPATRLRLREESQQRGWEALAEEARRLDPEFMAQVHPGDKTRVRRVLEVGWETGQRLNVLLRDREMTPAPWPVLVVWPQINRELAYARIEERVYKMRAAGLTAEVSGLLESGILPEAPGLATVGYREIVKFFQGNWDEEEAYRQIIRNTRRYAKRQVTWFGNRVTATVLDTHHVDPERVTQLWRGRD